ncbi:MAG: response regulator transcription factor [Sphingobacteriales bacterium]|nr:MAG: response regulator transcription factor [Sphingobacteriales bacterium]
MKIKCAIIEDLKVAADYLTRCCEKSEQLEVKGHFPDVKSALEFLNTNTVDLLFLDVEMPGATGFELLDNIAYKPKVILTTSREEYAYNAFQYNVADFLKKPFTYARFLEAVSKITNTATSATANTQQGNHIFIKSDGKLVRLNNEDILFIESMGDYVKFVTREKKYVTYNTIKSLEEKINKECFMRIHRSYIINLLKIDDIRENDLFINGIEIPISKNLRADVLKRLTIL